MVPMKDLRRMGLMLLIVSLCIAGASSAVFHGRSMGLDLYLPGSGSTATLGDLILELIPQR